MIKALKLRLSVRLTQQVAKWEKKVQLESLAINPSWNDDTLLQKKKLLFLGMRLEGVLRLVSFLFEKNIM